MNRRCSDASNTQFKDYGLRGIHVCYGWYSDWQNYKKDTESKPFPDATIDRANNDKGYYCGHCFECIENCWPKNWRWATRIEQNLNRRPSKAGRHADSPSRGTRIQDGRYIAKASIDGKSRYIGSFSTQEEAHQAYLDAISK